MPPIKDDFTWTRDNVSLLRALGSDCLQIEPDVVNNFEHWSILKLSALKNYVDIYTRIMNDKRLNRLKFSGRTYLDIFAGSGVNRIGVTGTPIAGSSPIAARFHCKDHPFSHFVAVEKDQRYAKALQLRMERLVGEDRVTVIAKDAN